MTSNFVGVSPLNRKVRICVGGMGYNNEYTTGRGEPWNGGEQAEIPKC